MSTTRLVSGSTLAGLVATAGAGLLLPAPAFAQPVDDKVLSDAHVETQATCRTLTINLNIRVQVLSYFPETAGRELHVRIRPLDSQSANRSRDSLPSPSSLPELTSLTYEGDNPSGPALSLLFDRDMRFDVQAGQDPQTVVIRLAEPGAGPICATGTVPQQSTAPSSPADAAATGKLIGDAEQAIRDKNTDRAVQLLTNAMGLPENANTPRALELLGLTRERKGQAAHARAAYQEYLRRYPQGEGADRVRQRLEALNAPAAGGELHAASGKAGSAKAWRWDARGSFSQFYYRDQSKTRIPPASNTLGTEVDNSVNVNQLLNTADITITGGNDRHQLEMRAAGSYTQNFGTSTTVITTNNGVNNMNYTSRPGGGVKALTALYLDYADNDIGTELRVGRQTRNSAGVLGRFDGALLGWQVKRQVRLNVVGGYPVLTSRQMEVLTDRPFYGVSLDLGAKRSPLQTTVYWFDERAKGGFVDRRSVGVEARLLRKHFNAFALVDYDVKFSTLNLALLTFNYNFPDHSNFSLTADYRKSPLLTTSNALIGMFDTATNMPIGSLAGLRPFFTDPEIYQLALDRTLTTKSLTMSYSRPLSTKLQANLDFTMTDTGGTNGTPATSGTPEIIALPAIGQEFYYGAQLVGSGLFWENDIYILSGRYADAATARTWTVDFNARVPITRKFRLSPRLRYGHRNGKITPSTPVPGSYSQFQPTVRINYYPIRHTEIEIEFGGDFSSQNDYTAGAWTRTSQQGWVLSAGYRIDF